MKKSERDTIDIMADTMRDSFPLNTDDVLIIVVNDKDNGTINFTYKGYTNVACNTLYRIAKEHDEFEEVLLLVGQRLAKDKLKKLLNNDNLF